MDISKEIDQMAEKLEKSVQVEDNTIDLIKSTIRELGPEGLKARMATMNDAQRSLLKSVLDEMKVEAMAKAKNLEPEIEGKSKDINPERKEVEFTEQDEKVADKAKKKKELSEVENQGDDSVQSGEVIKGGPGSGPKTQNELHLMTRAEYEKAHGKPRKNTTGTGGFSSHKSAVEIALNRGLEVPEHVLADYPDLKKGEETGSYGVDGDVIEKKESKEEGKEETKEDKPMSLDQKKAKAKENLHGMLKRMQERNMEKSKCIPALAKSLGASEQKLSAIWDIMAKGDVVAEKGPSESCQVSPAPIMKEEKPAKKQAPMSGKAKETADEGEAVPMVKAEDVAEVKKEAKEEGESVAEEMAEEKKEEKEDKKKQEVKKSYFYEEESVYMAKSEANPFAKRTTGQNIAVNVDELIEAQDTIQRLALKKSTFVDDVVAKAEDEMVQQVVEQNAKKQAKEEDEQKEAARNAQVDEKLTRIEERAGSKPMKPMLKSTPINDLIEQDLTFSDDQVERLQAPKIEKTGVLTKSFKEEDETAIFEETDMWGEKLGKQVAP